jgi:UDP-N-acetylmuramyl tripeptide synthase
VVETALVGRYNISNLLAIAAVLFDAGLQPTTWRVACPH